MFSRQSDTETGGGRKNGRVFKGPLRKASMERRKKFLKEWGAYGQMELMRMPSRACTIANSRVIARTPP